MASVKGLGEWLPLEFVIKMYEQKQIVTIVTDGKDLTTEKEPTRSPAK